MDRILTPGYLPTVDDVLRSRVQTTGIIETSFRVNKLTYRSVCVGEVRGVSMGYTVCRNYYAMFTLGLKSRLEPG